MLSQFSSHNTGSDSDSSSSDSRYEQVTDFSDECSPFADPAHDFASKISDYTDMLHSTGALSDYVAEITNSIPFRFRRFCNLPVINSSVEHIQDIPPIQDSSLTTSLPASVSLFHSSKYPTHPKDLTQQLDDLIA